MNRSKIGRSARWGAACAPCAAAKARCIRTQSSDPRQCDRCRSLEKNCVGQTPGPRKKRQSKPSTSFGTRVTMPEGLNDLSHPSVAPADKSSLNDSLDYVANDHPASLITTEVEAHVTPSQDETEGEPTETALNTPLHDFTPGAQTSTTCTCMATINTEDLVPVETDETLLSIYRNQLFTSFPFVPIPAGTTPRQLQATRPFLMKVVRTVASVRHLRLVRGQSRAVLEHMSNAILMRSERSLDLLQGILVFLGFYHYHCMAHAQLNNLIRLAVSLAEDLDLGTCPKSQQRRRHLPLVRAENPVSRTNEEKRALLGVWYVSSNAGLVGKQLAFTRFTKYMDQCLNDLDNAREYQIDQLIIQLIRIQQLTENVFHFYGTDSPVDEMPASPKSSTMARIDAFRTELDNLHNAMPSDLKPNYFLSCYHNSVRLRIFEPLLAGSHLPDTESQSFASLSLSGVPISEIFSHFTAALQTWVEDWLAVPVCSYFYMPQPAYVQLVHGAMMLSRWVRVAGPSAVKLSSTGNAVSRKEFVSVVQPTPALSGVPACPDLSLPRPPTSLSTQVESAQILNTLRSKVAAQSNLQFNVFGVLDTMAARFEAAKKEIAAAQGLDWENDTWDVAAEHSKMKKTRIEKWCETITIAAGEGRSPRTDVHDSVDEENREVIDMLPGGTVDDFGWAISNCDWDSMQWEDALFDEILQDLHA